MHLFARRLSLAAALILWAGLANAQVSGGGITPQDPITPGNCMKFGATKFKAADAGFPCFGGSGSFANPTALVGLTPTNGTATTAMRSDAAPALDQTAPFVFTGLGNTSILSGSTLVIGAASTISQLELTGWTVTSGGGTPPDYSTGNPQVKISGTLDPASAPGHLTGFQGIWNTTGSGATNLNGMRLQLDPGYSGPAHIIRVADFQNYVAGSHILGIGDAGGVIGVTNESQGLSTGDNIGTYSIADGASNYNFASFNRSFQSTQGGTQLANVGVVGVADTDAHAAIGGIFAIGNGNSGRWYPNDLGVSAALIADAQDSGAAVFLAKINTANVFSVTASGGVLSKPATNSVTMFQVANAAGSVILNVDSTNQRIGVGTVTPLAALHVVQPNALQGLRIDTYTATAGFAMFRANGSPASPTQAKLGDALGVFSGTSFGDAGAFNGGPSGRIRIVAAEDQSNTAHRGGYLTFDTVALVSGITVTERMRLSSTGGLSLGDSTFNATDPGAGNFAVQGSITIGNSDTVISRAGAATLQQGASSATPAAQIFQGPGSRAGTDSNVGGANLTVTSGNGTGAGTFSTISLKSPCANGGAATTAQTLCNGLVITSGVSLLTNYTVATLPACATGLKGGHTYVTDALAPTFLAAVVGGGAAGTPVTCDGTSWIGG